MYTVRMVYGKFFIRYSIIVFFVLYSYNLFCVRELKMKFGKNNTGELSISFLEYMKDMFHINAFIETGTYVGITAEKAAQVFDQVETVELSQDFYEKAKENLKDYKNIRIYQGDSAKMLNSMIKAATGNILFWLDGHYSANGSALGDVNTPILSELKCIKESGIKNAVIMIDDIRLFDKYINKLEDLDIGGYPTIPDVYTLLLEINPDYDVVIMGDILIAFQKSEEIIVSDVLRACSITRINLDLSNEELEKAAKTIGSVIGEEFIAIKDLYAIYCVQSHFIKHGIGAHYALWAAFQMIENQYYDIALEILKGPIKYGIDPDYIDKLINKVNVLSKA